MAEEIIRLTADDFEEAMAYMGMAFGFEAPKRFDTLLPSIYRPTDEWMSCNYAIRRNGAIVAVVGVYPRHWRVGGVDLKMGGIGGVCTHPEWRGKGLMKALMNRAVDDMQADGCHLSWLGGQRQRYQDYGFERAGARYSFNVNGSNLRHARLGEPRHLAFTPMDGTDTAQMAEAKTLHETRLIHCVRPLGDYGRFLKNLYHEPWAAVDSDGRLVGCLVADPESNGITEIDAVDAATEFEVLRAWIAYRDASSASVAVQPDDVELAQTLGDFGEAVSVGVSGNWQIFDWPAVIGALLDVKCRTSDMPGGRVVLDVEGKRFAMHVADGRGWCESTSDAPDASLAAFTAHRILLGPVTPDLVGALGRAASLLHAWCPLPAGFSRPDGV